MRNIFNVATEHVKQIKATRAAIADVSPTERAGGAARASSNNGNNDYELAVLASVQRAWGMGQADLLYMYATRVES